MWKEKESLVVIIGGKASCLISNQQQHGLKIGVGSITWWPLYYKKQ